MYSSTCKGIYQVCNHVKATQINFPNDSVLLSWYYETLLIQVRDSDAASIVITSNTSLAGALITFEPDKTDPETINKFYSVLTSYVPIKDVKLNMVQNNSNRGFNNKYNHTMGRSKFNGPRPNLNFNSPFLPKQEGTNKERFNYNKFRNNRFKREPTVRLVNQCNNINKSQPSIDEKPKKVRIIDPAKPLSNQPSLAKPANDNSSNTLPSNQFNHPSKGLY
ncbi:hypothetical protein ACTFIZ_012335 [Dictyostelium cf. discoideum]